MAAERVLLCERGIQTSILHMEAIGCVAAERVLLYARGAKTSFFHTKTIGRLANNSRAMPSLTRACEELCTYIYVLVVKEVKK